MDRTLGRYRLIAELGRGGMGTVFLAEVRGPARFSKLVVIKELKPAFLDDPTFTAMFLEEARLAARLQHPNIVQTTEVVCHPNDGYFIVMEYLEGAPLGRVVRRLRRRGDQSARTLYFRALLDLLAALEYAHDLKDFDGKPLGLVHRDVNPANVVVEQNGQIKLLDFGIAKTADSTQETRAGVLKGKLHYMSPEQMAGDRVDRRTDVFAAGAMLWDALTGRRLWESASNLDVVTALVNGAIPAPRSIDPTIAEDLDRICVRALARKASDRYPDAGSFREELERALPGGSISSAEVAATMAAEFADDQEQMRMRIAEHLQSNDVSRGLVPSFASQGSSAGTNSGVSRFAAEAPLDRPEVAEGPAGHRPSRRSAVIARAVASTFLLTAFGTAAFFAAWPPPGRGRDLRTSMPSPVPAAASRPPAEREEGAISYPMLRAVVHSHSDEIERCFDGSNMDEPVRVTLSATVDADGRVGGISMSAAPEGTGPLQVCIRGAVQGWLFPASAGRPPTPISYTFLD